MSKIRYLRLPQATYLRIKSASTDMVGYAVAHYFRPGTTRKPPPPAPTIPADLMHNAPIPVRTPDYADHISNEQVVDAICAYYKRGANRELGP